ncbi:hypothetical protein IAU60_004238 [Kwoniella sp. DSM 27419]
MPSRDPSLSPDGFAETQFVPQPDDDENLFEVLEILDERGPPNSGKGEYLVQWKGDDPDTGEPWVPTWERKTDCTAGLIAEWKAKRRANPEIVGQGRKKLEEMQRAVKNKRKRGSKTEPKGKNDKVQIVLYKSKQASRNSTSRNNSAVLPNDDFPQPVDLTPDTKRPTRTRKAKGSSPAQATSVIATTDEEGADTPARKRKKRVRLQEPGDAFATRESTQEVAQENDAEYVEFEAPGSAVRSASWNARGRTTARSSSRASDDQSNQADAGPGPATAAHRSKGASSRKLGPVPVASPSMFKNHLEDADGSAPESLHAGGSANQSQADPIRQFSSSPRSSNPQSQSVAQEASGQPEAQDDVLEESIIVAAAASKRPVKIRQELRDGVLISVADSDSDSDADANKRGSNGSIAKGDAVAAANTSDTDLDDLDSVHEDASTSLETSIPAATLDEAHPHQCRWLGCKEQAGSAEALAEHVRSHASAIHPGKLASASAGEGSAATKDSTTDPSASPTEADKSTKPDVSASRLAEAQETIAQLTRDLQEVQNAKKRLEEAKQTPASVVAEASGQPDSESAPTLDTVTKLRAEVKRLERSRKTLSADGEFIRQRYNEASSRAVEAVRENAELSEQVATLKSQLEVGLKQRSMVGSQVAKEREAEAIRLRAQVKILLDQSRLTDDAVRHKAVFYAEYKANHDRLLQQLSEKDDKIRSLSDRNENLMDQIESLRALQMGVIPKDEDDSDDYESDAEETDGSRSPSPSMRRSFPTLSATRSTSINILSEASGIIETLGEGQGFLCRWRKGEEECKVVCDTIEQLHDHGVAHHREEALGLME